uniref:Tyrosine specific protein phosphatases domain-containing protein n=1 Tax=Timema cristinae TaxID=61476 RepID=A0A7R9D7A5_TIMCR|nr:unnamed protein product [Timema cristinae]
MNSEQAGLGRTGSLIGAYLVKHYHMAAREAIAWLRICRPGCVIGRQQTWLEDMEGMLWKLGEDYSTLLQHWVLKPPYAIEELSTYARKKPDYIVNNLHGLPWDRSDLDYRLLESLIYRATTGAETVYVKWE